MRKARFIYFIMFLALTVIVKPNDLLTQAAKYYEAKSYKKAIENYEKLIKEGYSSCELFYNLGNAYYRDNQLGKAIFNYERARKINPNDADVKNNITIAYTKTIDKIEVKENFFVSAVKTNVLSSFTTTSWAWLTIIASFLVCIFLYMFFAGPSVRLRRISFFLTIIMVVGFFILYFLGNSARNSKIENNFAVITSPQVKIYTEPTATSNSKFNLHEGTRVKIIELNADWVLIKLENGNEGWLKTTEVGVF